jgi:hypothetical protein
MANDLPRIYNAFFLDPRTTITSHDHSFSTEPYLASRMTFDDQDNMTSSLARSSCRSGWYSEYDLAQFPSLHDDTSFATSWNSVPVAPAAQPPAPQAYGHRPAMYAQAAQPPTPQMSDLTGVSNRNDLDTKYATLAADLDVKMDVELDRFLQAFAAISTQTAPPETLPPPPPPPILPDSHAASRLPSQPPPVIAIPHQPPPSAPNLPPRGDEPIPEPSVSPKVSSEQVSLQRLQDQLSAMTQMLQEQQR